MGSLQGNQVDVDEIKRFAEDLQSRASSLLEELDQFENHLGDRVGLVKVRDLKRTIQKEYDLVDRVASKPIPDQNALRTMTSSNLPGHEALWTVAKTCEGITGFRRQFFADPKQRTSSTANKSTSHNTGKTVVDIIAQNDLEWIKICTMSENSMIHELAKQGWVDDSEDEDDDDPGFDDSNGLFKQMSNMIQASRLQMTRYQTPTVRLILTKLRQDTAASKLLQKLQDMGITIQTAEQAPAPTPLTPSILARMTAPEPLHLTDTLNIDCSILLGFASDISHQGVIDEEWHHADITSQIETESRVRYMPLHIWPVCGERKLVCTRGAAEKMAQIVSTIATESEKARTALILGTGGLGHEESVVEFQKLSDYPVPVHWMIPLEIVDVDLPDLRTRVDPVVHELFDAMLDVNQSVFFYGWTAGLTTITANGVGDRALQNVIQKTKLPAPSYGYPNIWTCGIARSLVGMQKEAGKGGTNVGQMKKIRKATGGRV